jgi:hypothetical protein
MNVVSSIFFWAGIVLLVDGSLGLLFQEKWQKLVRGVDIRRIALIEIAVAFALLSAHAFLLLNSA